MPDSLKLPQMLLYKEQPLQPLDKKDMQLGFTQVHCCFHKSSLLCEFVSIQYMNEVITKFYSHKFEQLPNSIEVHHITKKMKATK
uniref:Uncharacterized protein MANES_03G125000 n=1 Tax=Rhizophora mucronata TaxID=61149 RepID=A0A2P2L9M5_RHIMU